MLYLSEFCFALLPLNPLLLVDFGVVEGICFTQHVSYIVNRIEMREILHSFEVPLGEHAVLVHSIVLLLVRMMV